MRVGHQTLPPLAVAARAGEIDVCTRSDFGSDDQVKRR